MSTWRERMQLGAEIEVRTWRGGVECWTPGRVIEVPKRDENGRLRGTLRVRRADGSEIAPGRMMDWRER